MERSKVEFERKINEFKKREELSLKDFQLKLNEYEGHIKERESKVSIL